MKKINLITLFILFFLNEAFAQQNNTWVSFWNEDSTLIGFKDKTGKIKIDPKFNSFTTARRFDNIIGVAEEKDRRISNYYLTKKGKIAGNDNLYIFDNGADCESEGFIRFRDKITHKVGMFNGNGDIVIPANYDNLMPVRNGMIMAMKGGHWDASQQSEHNQFPWVGSKQMLIDTHNKVLIAKFPFDENINFYSLMISKWANKSPIKQNYKGTNGKYYSFMSFDKEFKAWLKDSLLNNLSRRNLLKFSYKNITFWDKQKHWIRESKQQFADKNFKMISSKLADLNSSKSQYEIFKEGLNPYEYDDNSKEFEKYYNNCGESKEWIYPVEEVVITQSSGKGTLQDQFAFLRTDAGYRLIEISINVGEVQ